MDAAPVASLHGTIVTHTVDHLAYSPSPPMIQAVVDVDGGGRCTIEVTDAEPERLRVGRRVAVHLSTAVHRRRRARLLLEVASGWTLDRSNDGQPRNH